jgi:hypothetical protein
MHITAELTVFRGFLPQANNFFYRYKYPRYEDGTQVQRRCVLTRACVYVCSGKLQF